MRGISGLFLFLLMLALTAHAGPQPGRYTGSLKVKKQNFGIPSVTSVRALARVSENGTLTIVLLTPPSLSPVNVTEKIETTLRIDDTCIIPVPLSPLTSPEKNPEFHGEVKVNGSRFSISYDDVPDRYIDANGDPVIVNYIMAPIPTAQFQFSFRRLGP